MKKFRIIFLALILLFVLTACSNKQSSSRADQTGKEESEKSFFVLQPGTREKP